MSIFSKRKFFAGLISAAQGIRSSFIGRWKKACLSTASIVLVASMGMTTQEVMAGPVFLGLGLDASGSMSTSDFELQRNAYINVLEDLAPELVANDVWVTMNQFASSVQTELTLTQVTLANVQAGGAIRTAFENMVKLGGGTNIAASIDELVSEYESQPADFFERAVIDISTDGQGTIDDAPADALAAGIDQINCLGVGAGANCDFVAGVDAFAITVDTFADFDAALTQKLQTEIGVTPVPEPSPLILFGASLLGLALVRRRNTAAQ